MTTKHRAISVASVAFSSKGVAATSLDEIARQLGVTKQTVLYHFGSKEGLLSAVFVDAAQVLCVELRRAAEQSEPGWPCVETIVRTSFSLALQRPELIGLLREVSRAEASCAAEAVAIVQPLIDDAVRHLDDGMSAGVYRAVDSRLVLLSTYAALSAAVADSEALRTLGLRLDTRMAVRLRSTILASLRSALSPGK